MKIERVAKKDEKNVIVYLDNGEKLFLSYEILLKNGLRKDTEISESRFSFLLQENQKYHIKQRALNYLSRRIHSKDELKIKLLQKKYDRAFIEEILDGLIKNKLVDDAQFAVHFVDEKIRVKMWGKLKLKSELMKKGINREIIEEVLTQFFPEGESLDNAVIAAEKKLPSLIKRNLEESKLKEKLFSFLISRGYDFETGKRAINKALENMKT